MLHWISDSRIHRIRRFKIFFLESADREISVMSFLIFESMFNSRIHHKNLKSQVIYVVGRACKRKIEEIKCCGYFVYGRNSVKIFIRLVRGGKLNFTSPWAFGDKMTSY